MATSAATSSFSGRRYAAALRVSFALLALAVLICGLWVRSTLRSALPELDGTNTVAGLSAPVTVIRDQHGFPTIQAANLNDLFFAQGYVTAQDRLFQMDGTRRFAAGELAEVVGESQIEHDRQQRILGLRVAARKTIDISSAEDRSHFEAYARGVNAFIESHQDRLPIEFRILRYSPKPWSSEDSALIGAYMIEELSTSPRHALTREKILAKLGPELTADLYVNSSWRDRLPTIPRPSLGYESQHRPEKSITAYDPSLDIVQNSPTDAVAAEFPDEEFFADRPLALGSNNWVVSGAHTVTAKPLLSNDMHLGHQMPNLWYAAHLLCGDLDVSGVTLPGYPYVVVGHNQHIAWGFTNLGPTVEDVYIETFNPAGEYLTPDGWKQPERRREVIHVKGKANVIVDVLLTRHGPIVTDLVPGETRKLALRWTLYDGVRNPFFAVNSAQDWEGFVQAFSQFDAPGQNVVYADVDGNIGYHATGKIPIRASGDGSLPENGSDNSHEWVGYVPFDKLPSVFNPPSGIIGTANGRVSPDKYSYSLSIEWEAPWRTERIYRVLESGKKFSPAEMLMLQTDIYSEMDRFFADRFVYAIDHAKATSPRVKAAAEILRRWDGRMSADSVAPTIAVRSREELTRLLLEPKLGSAPKNPEQLRSTLNWKSYSWMNETVWLDNVVEHQPKRWLPDSYSNYDELLAAAVQTAVAEPSVPQDLNLWRWGAFNAVNIQNPVLGQVPLLRRGTGPGVHEQSGSAYTIKAATPTHGPSERITVNLADLDQSTLNLVTGEAGNFSSPYYLDEWNAWYENFTFPWPYSADAVQKTRTHLLTLAPDK